MKRKQGTDRRRNRWLLAVLAFVVTSLAFMMLPALTSGDEAEVAPVSAADPAPSETSTTVAPPGCRAAQMVRPGEYEGLSEAGGISYVVLVPDSYRDIAPAPLFVLMATEPIAPEMDLEPLAAALGAQDGLIALGQTDGSPDELSTFVKEVSHAFCVDPDRVVTSLLPPLGGPSQQPSNSGIRPDTSLSV